MHSNNTIATTSVTESPAALSMPPKPQVKETRAHWLGRMISTKLPQWLAEPALTVLQLIHKEIQSPEERLRAEIRKALPPELREMICEYRIPVDIEEMIRNEMSQIAKTTDFSQIPRKLEKTLQKLEKSLAQVKPFLDKATSLDLHDIPLAYEKVIDSFRIGNFSYKSNYVECAAKVLQTLATMLPNITHLNLAHCSLHLKSGRFRDVIFTSFPQVTTLDISNNELQFTLDRSLLGNTDDIPDITDIVKLKNLKTLIVARDGDCSKNHCTQELKDALKEKMPHLEIIDEANTVT